MPTWSGDGTRHVRITDFATAAGGDRIDLANLVSTGVLSGWDNASNPFGSAGYLRLVQSGSDTLLQIDQDGGGNSWATVLEFDDTSVGDLTAHNSPFTINGAMTSKPVVAAPLADISSIEDQTVSFVLPAGAFTDTDGDALTLKATLGDGSALPSWLTFNAGAWSFTGTPPANFHGVLEVKVTASDGWMSASDTFNLTIAPVNDAPTGANKTATLLRNGSYTLKESDLGFTDSDGHALKEVIISTLLGNGTLKLDGVAVSVPGSTASIADIRAGRLVWEPASRAVGVALASLAFMLVDDGGTADGGIDQSGAYTLTYNVVLPSSPPVPPSGTPGDDKLTGTSGSDTLYGFYGNDTLDGGAGADRLVGGDGNDTYIVDNTGDAVAEGAGEGIDLVRSSVDYRLGPNVESLQLTGRDDLSGTGNGLANAITGNRGANVLSGWRGDDTLSGWAGNDTLYGGAGAEHLQGGTGNDLLSGGNGRDVLLGGGGNDTLYGGAGADRLAGGWGADTFIFDSPADSTVWSGGQDVIEDFRRGQGDKIDLTGIDANLTATGDQRLHLHRQYRLQQDCRRAQTLRQEWLDLHSGGYRRRWQGRLFDRTRCPRVHRGRRLNKLTASRGAGARII